jgi:hypothetical protein
VEEDSQETVERVSGPSGGGASSGLRRRGLSALIENILEDSGSKQAQQDQSSEEQQEAQQEAQQEVEFDEGSVPKTPPSKKRAVGSMLGVHSPCTAGLLEQAMRTEPVPPTKRELKVAAKKSGAVCKAKAKAKAKASSKSNAAKAKSAPKAKSKAPWTQTSTDYQEACKNFSGTKKEWLESEERALAVQAMTVSEIKRRRFEALRPDLFKSKDGGWELIA